MSIKALPLFNEILSEGHLRDKSVLECFVRFIFKSAFKEKGKMYM